MPNNKSSILEETNYYPFGIIMPNRNFLAVVSNYRFGFNTQEKVDEISGAGNHSTAEYWEYDTRLGRRWNLDLEPQISISDYAVNGNSPTWITGPLGDDCFKYQAKGEKNASWNWYKGHEAKYIGTDGKTYSSNSTITNAYGFSRNRLIPAKDLGNLIEDRGLYLHGKQDTHNWTHGCLFDKKEQIQNYFLNGAGKTFRGKVPLSVE